MRISVITRTFCRPRLLERAARSVAAARIDGLEWVVVDDDEVVADATRAVAEETASRHGIPVRLTCSARGGRAAAGNAGLAVASGEFVHFHDDDDTVEPAFYRTMLGYLADNPRYRGARAMCWRLHEEPFGSGYRVRKRKRIYPERQMVSLMAAAEVFAYPPIGTILDRSIVVEAGGFDTGFHVGEDYDLLLRFLLRVDIGTVPQLLANVHVRDRAQGGAANSPISRNFTEEDMLFRNAMLRRDLQENRLGLGWLLAYGSLRRQNRTLLDFLDAARKRIGL